MGELVLTGGTAWLDDQGMSPADIVISDGRISEIAAAGRGRGDEVVNVSGLTVMPGAVDAHVHLGHGSDIAHPRVPMDATTETAAAASGGVTCIIPFILSAEPYAPVFDEIREVTEAGARIDFGFHFVIATEDQLAEVPMLCRAGSPTAKLFMNIRGDEGARLGLPGTDDGFLFRLLEVLAAEGGMLCPHPENIEVAWVLRDRVMAQPEAERDTLAAWNATRPPFVEAEALSRAAYFGRITGTPVHGVHTSSGEALAAAVLQRAAGSDVSIETCIQYLTQDTDSEVGTLAKVNPPLRAPADRDALWDGIRAGQIDTIATDHIHRPVSSKDGGIWKAQPGFPGLDTFLPALLTEARKRDVPLEKILPLVTRNPARRMGLANKGRLAVGADADIAVIDTNASWIVDNAALATDGGYSTLHGQEMTAKVVHTLSRGSFVLRDGALSDDSVGQGRYVQRKLG
jgi:dihydroorotase-like cyclic amidohydrolase